MFWSLDLGIWIICHKSSSKNKLCIQVSQIVYSTLCIALQINATNQTRAMAMRSSILNVPSISHQNVKARTSSTQQSRGKLAMRLEKSSNREAFEIDEVLNYSKMEDSPYQIDAGFQKNINTMWVHQQWCNWRPFIFITPRDLFTGYGWWCGLVLYWFLTLSQISELLQWPNHVVCFFHCFNSSQRKNPQQPKNKGCWQYEVVLCTKNPLHPLLSVEIPKEFFPSLGTALASTASPSGVACEGSCV